MDTYLIIHAVCAVICGLLTVRDYPTLNDDDKQYFLEHKTLVLGLMVALAPFLLGTYLFKLFTSAR